MQEEIDDAFTANDDIENTGNGFSSLQYMNQVINETLRFYPIAAHSLARRCSAHTEICGHRVPMGTYVVADVCSVHSDPDLWGPQDPAVFDPDRFADEQQTPAPALLAFGVGPRRCIGQRLALLKMRTTLFHILRRYSIRPAESCTVRLRPEPTMAPDGPLEMVLEPRFN